MIEEKIKSGALLDDSLAKYLTFASWRAAATGVTAIWGRFFIRVTCHRARPFNIYIYIYIYIYVYIYVTLNPNYISYDRDGEFIVWRKFLCFRKIFLYGNKPSFTNFIVKAMTYLFVWKKPLHWKKSLLTINELIHLKWLCAITFIVNAPYLLLVQIS